MAIIKLGALVAGVRGTLGGNVFSANKGGPYVKAWGRGSNPRTTRQSVHRGNLINLAQSWRNVAAIDKGNWDVYAALPAQELTNSLGEAYFISGFNWFCRINLNRFSAGLAQSDAFPTLGIPAVPIVTAVQFFKTSGSSTSRIFLDAGDPEFDELHVFKATMYNSHGRLVASEIPNFLVTKLHGVSPFVTVFQSDLEAKFGTIIEGQKGFLSVQTQFADGRRGPAFTGSDEVRA